MEISKVLSILLFVFSGSILLLLIVVPVFVKLNDWWAKKAARKYCDESGLEFVEAKAWPNHYGLYFRKDGKRLYASYDFERNRTITWKKGSPLEIAEAKKGAVEPESGRH